MGPCIPDRIGIWKCCFLWREENRRPGEKPLEQRWEPTTNSTHIWRRVLESNPGHIGGRRALSLLRHPCSPRHPCDPPGRFLTNFTFDNSNSRYLEPFSISLESSSYRDSTVMCGERPSLKLSTVASKVGHYYLLTQIPSLHHGRWGMGWLRHISLGYEQSLFFRRVRRAWSEFFSNSPSSLERKKMNARGEEAGQGLAPPPPPARIFFRFKLDRTLQKKKFASSLMDSAKNQGLLVVYISWTFAPWIQKFLVT